MSDTATVLRRPRTRLRLAAVLAVVLAGIGVLAMSNLDDSLVFYRTPTELAHDDGLVGERVRVGGQVVPGSLRDRGNGAAFALSDGTTELPVVYQGVVPGVFREGEGALVEGVLGRDGVFVADQLMVKHSENYRAPGGDSYSPPAAREAGR